MKKVLYIGLDAHSKNCYFVVMNSKGQVVDRKKVCTNEKELLGFIRSVKGHRSLVSEEGMLSQWIYVLLKDEVEQLVVCKAVAHEGPKNDFIDARELADLLRVGRVTSVFHSSDKIMEIRTLISGYEDLNQDLVRTKNRYSALFRQSAIVVSGAGFYRDDKLIKQLPTEPQRHVAWSLYERIALLEMQKMEFHEQFKRNEKRFKPIRLIMSIPGFGIVRAIETVGIMVTPHRFATKYYLNAYAMLVKHCKESDGKSYGKIAPQGQRQLQEIFKSATRSVLMSKTNAFRREYDQKRAAGMTDDAAQRWIRRALAATVLGVWKTGKKYDDKYREVTRKQRKDAHSEV